MKYRKYDPMVKKMIIETGNRNLFPELNIPRTTINYWLKESREVITSDKDRVYQGYIDNFKKENFDLKAKNSLMKKCLKNTIENNDLISDKSLSNKKKIVTLVDEYREFLSLKVIL